MRAVNEAGTTDAEYVFSTLTLDGSTIPPLIVSSDLETDGSLKFAFTSKWVVQQLNLILPILCGLGALTLGLIVICSLQMRKGYANGGGIQSRVSDPSLSASHTLSESVYKIEHNPDLASPVQSSVNPYKTETTSTEARSTGDQHHQGSLGGCRQAQPIYYPSPYALSRIEDYRGNNQDVYGKCEQTYKLRPITRTQGQVTSYHDYDTPIFLKRVNLNPVSPSLE